MAGTELLDRELKVVDAEDTGRLGAVKARVDPDATILANHPV